MPGQAKNPHILILFSDTGGGHRSAAEAIVEALEQDFKGSITTEMVDFFKDYAPVPFNKMPDWYPDMVKAPQLWGLSFKASDGRRRARVITAWLWPYASRAARALVRKHPCDMIVTVHPVATTMVLKALGRNRPPFIIVVTDMVSTHALWYDKRADLILVPTEMARQRAIEYTMPVEKLRVVGLPVTARCSAPLGDKQALRKKLGWPFDKTVVLLVGGGEGMGPLGKTARTIAASGLDVSLAIVTGRNVRLKKHLDSLDWPVPAFVYGFTRDMPDLMRAADVLVTKAGPGTISEALNAHLPIILYTRLPGQEDGNVNYVVTKGAGGWAPSPGQVVDTLTEWVQHPEERERVVEACRQAARPQAARIIAHILAARLGLIEERTSLIVVEDL